MFTHIGLWRAALQIDEIADMLAASTTLPFLYGFSKKRWKKSLHVMLQKLDQPYHPNTAKYIWVI